MQISSEKKVKLITIMIICVAFVLMLILTIQFIKIGNLNAKKANLQNSYNTLEENIEKYSSEMKYYQDKEQYLKDYAHQYLDWSKPGETIYVSK